MVSYDFAYRVNQIEKSLLEFKSLLIEIQSSIKPENDIWDNADMIQNWKVSERTLAEWRKDKKISYVKVNSKIWYTAENRLEFLSSHTIHNQLNDGRE